MSETADQLEIALEAETKRIRDQSLLRSLLPEVWHRVLFTELARPREPHRRSVAGSRRTPALWVGPPRGGADRRARAQPAVRGGAARCRLSSPVITRDDPSVGARRCGTMSARGPTAGWTANRESRTSGIGRWSGWTWEGRRRPSRALCSPRERRYAQFLLSKKRFSLAQSTKAKHDALHSSLRSAVDRACRGCAEVHPRLNNNHTLVTPTYSFIFPSHVSLCPYTLG